MTITYEQLLKKLWNILKQKEKNHRVAEKKIAINNWIDGVELSQYQKARNEHTEAHQMFYGVLSFMNRMGHSENDIVVVPET